jgi:hypothetical protein
MLVMPAEVEWIIKRYAADLTSRSLHGIVAEGHACRARAIGMDIKRYVADLTSRSLRERSRQARLSRRKFTTADPVMRDSTIVNGNEKPQQDAGV